MLTSLIKSDPDNTKFAFDVISYVSAGALHTLALSFFDPGDEEKAVKYLS